MSIVKYRSVVGKPEFRVAPKFPVAENYNQQAKQETVSAMPPCDDISEGGTI
jgi:hypothetical protein